jgi:predicted Holliday junction resolvase-like endonuclease
MVVSDLEFGIAAGAAAVLLLLAVAGWALWYRKREVVYSKEDVEKIVDERLAYSRNILKGQIGEQIAPHMKEFIEKYDPADARYLGGKPVDYIVYKGYSQVYGTDQPIDEVVFVEIKTSKETRKGLDKNEAKIKEAIEAKRVRHDVVTLHIN